MEPTTAPSAGGAAAAGGGAAGAGGDSQGNDALSQAFDAAIQKAQKTLEITTEKGAELYAMKQRPQ